MFSFSKTKHFTHVLCVKHQSLTQFIEMGVNAIGTWHRANQASLQECRPFIHKTSVSTKVILKGNTSYSIEQACYTEVSDMFLFSHYLTPGT